MFGALHDYALHYVELIAVTHDSTVTCHCQNTGREVRPGGVLSISQSSGGAPGRGGEPLIGAERALAASGRHGLAQTRFSRICVDICRTLEIRK
jgi:hypothetical protein